MRQALFLTGSAEVKTYEYDGLKLRRAPQGVELIIDLKGMVEQLESERAKVIKALLAFRGQLIKEAVEKIGDFDAASIYKLTLSGDPKTRAKVEAALISAYKTGRAQVKDDLARQRAKKGRGEQVESKAGDILKRIWQIADLVISKAVNEIQRRAIDIFVSATNLDANTRAESDSLSEQIGEALEGESTAWAELAAGASVNVLIQAGRGDEIEAQKDSIEWVEYSAILDAATCDPCEDEDGKTSQDAADLQPVPNPECQGGDRCRCFHVAVIV